MLSPGSNTDEGQSALLSVAEWCCKNLEKQGQSSCPVVRRRGGSQASVETRSSLDTELLYVCSKENQTPLIIGRNEMNWLRLEEKTRNLSVALLSSVDCPLLLNILADSNRLAG